MSSSEFEQQALRIVQNKLKQCGAAIVKPYSEWISEDYFIFNLSQLSSDLLAPDLLAQHGDQIAEIVRGETRALSPMNRGKSYNQAYRTTPQTWP